MRVSGLGSLGEGVLDGDEHGDEGKCEDIHQGVRETFE